MENENTTELIEALSCAFDICFITKDMLGNIMAAENDADPSDIENYNKADIFLKWYSKTFAKNKT